jgi:hypothetical protein
MPTKKNSPKRTSATINDAASTQNAAVSKRGAGAKEPASPDQKQHTSSDSPQTAPVSRAKARKSIAEFDDTHHHAEVAHEAYLLWLERGCAHGSDFEDWTRAIEIVRQRHLA